MGSGLLFQVPDPAKRQSGNQMADKDAQEEFWGLPCMARLLSSLPLSRVAVVAGAKTLSVLVRPRRRQDVAGCAQVRVLRMTAGHALEFRLTFSGANVCQPHTLHVCDVWAAETSMTSPALYSSVCRIAPRPVAGIARFGPGFFRTFLPGFADVPFAECVTPFVFSFCCTQSLTICPRPTNHRHRVVASAMQTALRRPPDGFPPGDAGRKGAAFSEGGAPSIEFCEPMLRFLIIDGCMPAP